ncbi:MAG: hypothetical protein ABI688_06870 [Bacteroidota bacterium]
MKLIIFLLFLVTTTTIACKNKKQTSPPDTADTTTARTTTTTTVAPDAAADSADIRNLVMDFYDWYNKNYAKFMRYDLYSGIKKKDLPPYKINWNEVTKYQQFIHDSVSQLGEAFLANQKRFFQQCDSAFKVDVKDELPYGFDYDWYTNSQEEPSYLLDGISKSGKWIISVKGHEASVEIGAPEDKNYISGSLLLYVGIKKENGQWKIARIGND